MNLRTLLICAVPTSYRLVQEVVLEGGASLRVKQALVDAGGRQELLIGQLHQLLLPLQAGQANQVAAVEKAGTDLLHFGTRANLS